MKHVLVLIALVLAACSSTSNERSPGSTCVGMPPVEPQVTVRVVERDTGRPVPGARIRIPDTFDGDLRAFEDFNASGPNEDERWERIGHDVETDARGEVRLAANAVTMGLRASKDGLFGVCPPRRAPDRVVLGSTDPIEASAKDAAASEPDGGTAAAPEEILIELVQDESMIVHCVDEHGHPAIGAIVGLRPKAGTKAPEDGGDYWWWAWVRSSDGIVTVEHLQDLRKRFAPSEVELVAGPLGEYGPPVVVRLASNERVELVSAAACGLIVNVRTSDGSPLPGDTHLTLGIRVPPKSPEATDDEETTDYFVPVREGRVEFRCLPLSKDFAVTVRGTGWREASSVIAGPNSSGESANATITLGERLETLVGRLMLEDGTPYHDPFLHAWIDENGTRIDLEDFTEQVDDVGHFRMDLNASMSAVPDRTLTIEAEIGLVSRGPGLRVGRSLGEQEVVRATLDLSRALQPGQHDVGDIVLKHVGH